MKRWHQEKQIARRKQRRFLWVFGDFPGDVPVGRFRKVDGFCDTPGCICKSHERPKRSDAVADIAFRDQLKELKRDEGAIGQRAG